MSIWKLISIQSPANHGYYHGEALPLQAWDWPK
jgi:hypothetical protein